MNHWSTLFSSLALPLLSFSLETFPSPRFFSQNLPRQSAKRSAESCDSFMTLKSLIYLGAEFNEIYRPKWRLSVLRAVEGTILLEKKILPLIARGVCNAGIFTACSRAKLSRRARLSARTEDFPNFACTQLTFAFRGVKVGAR